MRRPSSTGAEPLRDIYHGGEREQGTLVIAILARKYRAINKRY